MCRANAPVTGDGVPSARCGHVEQALLEHEPGAVVALLAGLEHEQHPPGELVAAAGQQLGRADEHRRVGVVAAGVHRPVGRATRSRARCPRAAAGRPCRRAAGSSGPARPPVSRAAMPLVVSCTVTSSGRPSSAPSTCSWVTGSSLPTSGHWCSVRRSSTVGGRGGRSASSRSARPCRRACGHGRHGPVSATGREPCAVRATSWSTSSTRTTGSSPRHPPADAGRAAAPPGRVRRRHVDDRAAARPPPQRRPRTCGRAAGTSASAASSAAGEAYDDAARRELAEEVGVDRRRARCRSADGRYADADVDLVAPLLPRRPRRADPFADGEVAEARWVDARRAGCAAGRRASFVPDSLALLPLEILFPFPAPANPHGR